MTSLAVLAFILSPDARAACTVTLLAPADGVEVTYAPTFRWRGSGDCSSYRVQVAANRRFTSGVTTVNNGSRTRYVMSATTWETNVSGSWAAGAWWRIQSTDSTGVRTYGATQFFTVDPDLDGDGYTVNDGDCDDGDAAVYPGAVDDPTTAVDSDCDPTTDDLDGDGYSQALGDCDDTDGGEYPGGIEFPDGVDNNCNGLIDEEIGGSVASNLQTALIAGLDYGYATAFAYPLGDGRAYTHANDGDGWYVYTEFHGASAYGYATITTHLGEDWNAEDGSDQGDPVLAVANGVVVDSQYYSPGWGECVVVRHDAPEGGQFALPDGTTSETALSMYCHVQNRLVADGDVVSLGDQICEIGPTASGSTAPHLHFEVGWDLSQSYPGSGYSANSYGRVDPSEFLDLNANVSGSPTVGCADSAYDFSSIQEAIDAASDGDTVEICSGTYTENLDIDTRVLTLVAADGDGTVTVEGDGTWYAVEIVDSTVNMEGLVVTGGAAVGYGGGLHLYTSDVTIADSRIVYNEAELGAGGILVMGGSLMISDSEVSGNVVNGGDNDDDGGGLGIFGDAQVILDNVLVENNYARNGGGIFLKGDHTRSTLTMVGGTVSGNAASYAGGLYVYQADAEIVGVDVTDNTISGGDAGIAVYYGGDLVMQGGTLSDNLSSGGGSGGLYVIRATAALNSVTLSGNQGAQGAGRIITGTVTLTDCTVSNPSRGTSYAGGFEVEEIWSGTYGDATLTSVNTTWNNDGKDIITDVAGYTYEGTYSFVCTQDGCS